MRDTIKTVRELIEELSKYDGDLIVRATWEGIHTDFKRDGFESDGNQLTIDVDQY